MYAPFHVQYSHLLTLPQAAYDGKFEVTNDSVRYAAVTTVTRLHATVVQLAINARLSRRVKSRSRRSGYR